MFVERPYASVKWPPSVIAKGKECTLEFAIIGVASDAHLDGELADTDEVLGRSEWKPCRILLRSELVGRP